MEEEEIWGLAEESTTQSTIPGYIYMLQVGLLIKKELRLQDKDLKLRTKPFVIQKLTLRCLELRSWEDGSMTLLAWKTRSSSVGLINWTQNCLIF